MLRTCALFMGWGVVILAGLGWAGEGGEYARAASADRGVSRASVAMTPMDIAPVASRAAASMTTWHAGASERDVPQSPEDFAWIAEYTLRDTTGDRRFILVRTVDRVEYRLEGEPVRSWRRLADGVEHREVRPADARVVVYSPGDLRALGEPPDWGTLHALVPMSLRAQLRAKGTVRVQGHTAQRWQGEAGGARITVDWLADANLPARYVRRADLDGYTLTLRSLRRMDATTAFLPTTDLREIDYADLGDMEHDDFARQHIRQGFQAH